MKFNHKGAHSLDQLAYVRSAIARVGGKSTETLFLAENAVMQGIPEAEEFLDGLLQTVRQADVSAYLGELKERLKFVRSLSAFPAIIEDQQVFARLYEPSGHVFLPANQPTNKLMIVFTTIFNNYQFSNALMYAMLRPLGASILFLKDNTYRTFLGGVAGFGGTIEDTVREIMRLAQAEGLRRIYVTGFSSGGYASLYAAALMPCTAYLGLSIYVDTRPNSPLPRQLRFSPAIENQLSESVVGAYQRDLKPLLEARPTSFPAVLCYGERSKDDRLHAMHMGSVQGVEVRCVEGAGHGLVGHMMRTGDLAAPFEELLATG